MKSISAPDRLRLSPFEEYLFWEDTPAHPCWIVVKCCFAGELEPRAFQRAVDQTIARHRLLRSRLRRGGMGRFFWEEVPGWRCEVEWLQDSPGEWPEFKGFDLFAEPGFRLFAWNEDGDRSFFVFHCHHSVCDGKALRDLFYDILVAYKVLLGEEGERPALDETLLPARNRLSETWPQLLRVLPYLAIGLWVSWRFQRKRIAPLLPGAAVDSSPQAYPALVSQRLDWGDFQAIRRVARKAGYSVNDLLLRDLFVTIGLWRREYGVGDPMDWIRIVLPVDVRKPADRFLPAANVTSIVTLDRRSKSLGNRERLPRRIHEQMEWVKARWVRYTFWVLLRLISFWPGGIRAFARRPHCQGTIVFANHCHFVTRSPLNKRDEKTRIPGAVMEDIKMISPIRQGTAAALVVGTYAERFYCDLHYDPSVIDRSQAGRFLGIFASQLALYSQE